MIAQVCASGGLKRESIRGELNESRCRAGIAGFVAQSGSAGEPRAPDPHQRSSQFSKAPEDCAAMVALIIPALRRRFERGWIRRVVTGDPSGEPAWRDAGEVQDQAERMDRPRDRGVTG